MYSKAMILSKKNNFETTLTLIKAAFDYEASSESRPRCEPFPVEYFLLSSFYEKSL
jgi:hypothetical protein